jgi:hypothetical protein
MSDPSKIFLLDLSDPSKIIPGSYADWANYRLGSNNGTYPKPTVGPDYEALDEAKAKALERFERDYDLLLRDDD